MERELGSQAKRTRGVIAASLLKSRRFRGRPGRLDLENRFISGLRVWKRQLSGFFASAPGAICGRIGPLEAAALEFVDSRGQGRIGARPPTGEPIWKIENPTWVVGAGADALRSVAQLDRSRDDESYAASLAHIQTV